MKDEQLSKTPQKTSLPVFDQNISLNPEVRSTEKTEENKTTHRIQSLGSKFRAINLQSNDRNSITSLSNQELAPRLSQVQEERKESR